MAEDHDESDEDHDYSGEFYWEGYARGKISALLEDASFDRESGTIAIDNEDWDPKGRHSVHRFRSLEALRRALVEIGDNEMVAHVPWENGPVFSTDSDDIVDAALEEYGVTAFFDEVRGLEEDVEPLVMLEDLCAPDGQELIVPSFEEINARLIDHLARHPELMRELNPRQLEELVAELFRRMGYDVLLTPPARDGGRDIQAVRRSDVGTLLTLVECKRFSPEHKVGVGLVRALYGVVESERASHGVIATTSSFTRGAKEFQRNLRYRLSLSGFDDLARWCSDLKGRR